MRFTPTALYAELRGDPAAELAVNPTGAQSSNTTLRVGDGLFLKIYRKLQPGLNPELEIGRYLTEVAHFPNIVPVAGAVEYIDQEVRHLHLALLQAFVTNQGDGWDYTSTIWCASSKTAAAAFPCSMMRTGSTSRW